MNKFYNHKKSYPETASTKVVSLNSGKGGVGKSVLAFNLAQCMAAMGEKVLLVDTDLNFGNLHILANTQCDYGLKEFLREDLTLKEAVTKLDTHLDLLASINDEHVFLEDDIKSLTRLMRNLIKQSSEYKIIIIDQSSGISKLAKLIAHSSDINLMILVPEITSISDCYGLFKSLITADKTLDCRLVINRVESEKEAEYIYGKFCALADRFIQNTPAYSGYISEDILFKKSLSSQLPLSQIEKESIVVHQLAALARKLTNKPNKTLNSREIIEHKTINKNLAVADIKE